MHKKISKSKNSLTTELIDFLSKNLVLIKNDKITKHEWAERVAVHNYVGDIVFILLERAKQRKEESIHVK